MHLSGSVGNSYLKRRAGALVATGTKNATSLVNQNRYDYIWEDRPDSDIRNDVEEQLSWNPFVEEGNISVGVSNGVVTLEGNVDNWSAEETATAR